MPSNEYVRVKLSDIEAIADAIRAALGIDSTFKVSDMPTLIAEIVDTRSTTVEDIYTRVGVLNTTVGNNTTAVNNNTTAIQNAVTKFFEYNNISAQTYELTANTDKTFKNVSTSLGLTFPSTVVHGYLAGANIIDPAEGLVTTITNNSSFAIKLVKNGVTLTTIAAGATANISQYIIENISRFVADCDGAYIYFYLTEVEDE